MALTGRMLVMQLTISLVVAANPAIAAAAAADQALPPQALPGCPDHCGNLTISYPFGIGDGCFLRERFNLTCNESAQPPTTLWLDGSFIATNIFLTDGELQVLNYIAYDCYYYGQDNQTINMYDSPSNDKHGHDNQTTNRYYSSPELWLHPPFTISGTRNKFIAVGCDTSAIFEGYRSNDEDRYIAGCMSICDNLDSAVNGSCSGIGCCQISIPTGLKNRTVTLNSYFNHTYVRNFNPCSYAFIVEDGKFTFNPKTSFQELTYTEQIPMIINWDIEEGSCAQAQNSPGYACKANSKCVNRTIDTQTEPSGYYCQCLQGFEGNPYLPDGCQDIDECMPSINPCNNGTCTNSPGDYSCVCKKGFRNEGPKSCIQNTPKSKNKSLKISLGVTLGFLVLVVVGSWIHCLMSKRRIIKLKEKYFKENGGLTLQQHLASRREGVDTTKIFTAEELEKATNNYHENRVLGEGGYGTVYKGILQEDKVVAIKKSKVGARTQSDHFVNEVIFLSQINHKNVVRLLGCCFETEVPLLVYEYITHGTLHEHVFNTRRRKGSSLSWELRLKIATETAGALAYLHSSISTPIVHRDVKAANILLDQNYTAKVSDFGASRFVPEDETQVATIVQGTMGYLDPEYLQSNRLTEKSDVYSFGVVLAELLTSKVAISYARREDERSLASLFISALEKKCLIQILDADIVNDGNIETMEQVAILAKRCLKVKGEDRPMMKEVAAELEGIGIVTKHPWKYADFCPEETQHLLGSPKSKAYVGDIRGEGEGEGNSSGIGSGFDSFQIQTLMPYDGTTSGLDSMQIQTLMPYNDGR